MNSCVALIIFKRLDTTCQVFERIRQARPSKLLVIADGPRTDRPEEVDQCRQTRAVIDRVDWDCQVFRNYAEINLGCRQRVATGLDWIFTMVDEAIILEDDCLPDPTFFQFCEQLLEKYRYDQRVMMISGSNYMLEWKSHQQSYHFSYGNSIWGWATWRRAWQHYDLGMQLWSDPDIRNRIKMLLADDIVFHYRSQGFDRAYQGQEDDWAYAWDFAKLLQSGLTIFPSRNLIANIGIDMTSRADEENRTRRGFQPQLSNLSTGAMAFPLREPHCMVADKEYDLQRMLKACGVPRKKLLLKFALDNIGQLTHLMRRQLA